MIQGTVLFFSKYPFFVFVKNATAYETTIPYFHRKVKKYPHCLFGNTVFRFGHGVLPTGAPPCSDGRKIPCGENLFCRLQSGKAIRQRSLNAKKQDKRGRKKDGGRSGRRPFYLAQEEGFEPPCLLGKRFSRPPRCDRFDIPAYFIAAMRRVASPQAFCLCGGLPVAKVAPSRGRFVSRRISRAVSAERQKGRVLPPSARFGNTIQYSTPRRKCQ